MTLEATPWTFSEELHPDRDTAKHGITGYRVRDAAGEILAEAYVRPYRVKPRPAHLRAMAAAPALLSVLERAVAVYSDQFDGDPDSDLHVSGADLVDWFTAWREEAKAAIRAARGEA